MQCSEVQALFTDFADNTLAREELHALTDHLFGCPDCAAEWQEFRQTVSLVRGLEDHSPPADLLPGIHAKLAKKGMFDRAWTFVQSLDFSVSIPAAAAIFTIAMLAGFLLKTSPVEQPAPSRPSIARTGAQPQGEVRMARRQPIVPSALFAVSHNGGLRGDDFAMLGRSEPAIQPGGDNHLNRLLSPDMHVLFNDMDSDGRVEICREMLHHNWRLHRLENGLILVHLPQADLEQFHEILDQHRFVLVPSASTESDFGHGKKVLTAAIRFR